MNVYDFDGTIFYSDSLADTPLALCAEKAHLVKDHATTAVDWPKLEDETVKIVKDKIDTGWMPPEYPSWIWVLQGICSKRHCVRPGIA